LLWLVSDNVYYLIAANIVSGFAWSGFILAGTNFVYDASEARNRTKHIALFNATDGVAICCGALVGGYLIPHLPAIFGYQLRTLFAVSGVLRGVVVLLLLRQVVEVRRVPKTTILQFLLGRSGPAFTSQNQVDSYYLTQESDPAKPIMKSKSDSLPDDKNNRHNREDPRKVNDSKA